MSKATIIVGLPGSGKTTYAKSLVQPGIEFFDDPAVAMTAYNALQSCVQAGGEVVVTDVYSLTDRQRQKAETLISSWGATHIDWVFFENDPDACIANLNRRNDGRLISDHYVREMAKEYTIPAGATVLPVYRP